MYTKVVYIRRKKMNQRKIKRLSILASKPTLITPKINKNSTTISVVAIISQNLRLLKKGEQYASYPTR